MRKSALRNVLLLGVLASTSCNAPTSSSSVPCDIFDLTGTVTDDAWLLPDKPPSTPLEGATVRITGGRDSGTATVTDASGRFAFDGLRFEGERVIEASAQGFETITETLYLGGSRTRGSTRCPRLTSIELGQVPHTIWGDVQQAVQSRLLTGALVKILDGPNAGASARTNESALFRIDGLETSGRFRVQVSADGYTATITEFASLRRNSNFQFRLFAAP